MRNIIVRVVLAASMLMLVYTPSTAQVACIGQKLEKCVYPSVPRNITHFDCGYTYEAAANKMCQNHGGVMYYNYIDSVGGNQCGYAFVQVNCMNATICIGQSPNDCSPGMGPTLGYNCDFAITNQGNLDLAAATEYCNSGSMGVLNYNRLSSVTGGQCGFTYDSVTCAPMANGALYAKYYILTIFYAPPGCGTTGGTNPIHCPTNSSMVYSQGSSTGTTTTIAKSTGRDLSITVKIGSLGDSVGGGFDTSKTTTDSSAETITKSQSQQVTIPGQQEDGIDHNNDQIRILLNPAVSITTIGNSTGPLNMSWNMGWHPIPSINATTGPFYYDVFVWELRDWANGGNKSPNKHKDFTTLGFTSADYITILSQDPFAYANNIHPRIVPTTFSNFPYVPETNCNVYQAVLKNDFQEQNVASSTRQYKVSVTATGTIPGIKLITAVSGTVGDIMTWVNTSTTSHLSTSTETATANISCPSSAYPPDAPGSLALYWDTLYGSFVFIPQGVTGQQIIHQGTVVSHVAPVRHLAVDLKIGGITYHTFTNNNGEYAFYSGVIKPNAEHPITADVSVGGVHQTVTIGAASKAQINLANPVAPVR